MSEALDLSSVKFPDPCEILFKPAFYKVLYGGRGSAKSWSVARALLIGCLTKGWRVLCVRQTQTSMKQSVYKLLCMQIEAMGLKPYFQVLKDEIRGPHPDSGFFFEGIHNNEDKLKSYEGIDRCWVEEAQAVTYDSWETLLPTIRKPGAEVWITFNPKYKSDETYKRFVISTPASALVAQMNWRDNPWFDGPMRLQLEQSRADDYNNYLHIWEGHCKILSEGAVFAKQLSELYRGKRVMRVPYASAQGPVDTIWDLGISDMMTIWFRQKVGFEYHYVDYYQNRGFGLAHYLQVLQKKGYVFGTHWLPHDAKARDKGSGLSFEEQFRKFGPTRIVKKLKVEERIEAGRSHFPLCYFDEEKCRLGLEALGGWRYEVVNNEGTLSQKPVHDENSHGADSFTYSAVSTGMKKGDFDQGLGLRLNSKGPAGAWAGRGLGEAKVRSSTGWMK